MKNSKFMVLVIVMIFAFSIAPTVLGMGDNFDNNCAPIAQNLEFKTYKNVTMTGNVSAFDPDGGNVIFYISEVPNKGLLKFDQSGSFVYTPNEGVKGKDSFTYYAVDDDGAASNEATVDIMIDKQKTEVWYSNLEGETSHYPALVLAEQGIYIGEALGNEYFFNAQETVTKGKFLAMCMKLCGAETIEGVIKTGYVDDSDIPMWIKPYAAAALMTGVLDASQKELNSEAAITCGEAMVILDSAMNITDVYCDYDNGVLQAFANLSACRIVADDLVENADAELTMAGAAEMLASAYEILERR